jgi:hypothetical protein
MASSFGHGFAVVAGWQWRLVRLKKVRARPFCTDARAELRGIDVEHASLMPAMENTESMANRRARCWLYSTAISAIANIIVSRYNSKL